MVQPRSAARACGPGRAAGRRPGRAGRSRSARPARRRPRRARVAGAERRTDRGCVGAASRSAKVGDGLVRGRRGRAHGDHQHRDLRPDSRHRPARRRSRSTTSSPVPRISATSSSTPDWLDGAAYGLGGVDGGVIGRGEQEGDHHRAGVPGRGEVARPRGQVRLSQIEVGGVARDGTQPGVRRPAVLDRGGSGGMAAAVGQPDQRDGLDQHCAPDLALYAGSERALGSGMGRKIGGQRVSRCGCGCGSAGRTSSAPGDPGRCAGSSW